MKRIVKLVTSTTVITDYVLVNGKNPTFTYCDRLYTSTFETEREELHIKMDTFHPLLAKKWWIKEILFFLISIFGIFDTRKFKENRAYEYEAIIPLHDGENVITFNIDIYNPSSFKLVTDGEVEEKKNQMVDISAKLKKRKVGLVFSKIGVFVLVAALIAVIAIFAK